MVQSTEQREKVSQWLRRVVFAFAFVSLAAAGACDEGVLLPEPEEELAPMVDISADLG